MTVDSTERVRAYRQRNRIGSRRRAITVTKDQLDQLEVLGYLDPDLRGECADEAEAIETFLTDSLIKR